MSLGLGERNHRLAQIGDIWRLGLLCGVCMMVGRGQGGDLATVAGFLVLSN